MTKIRFIGFDPGVRKIRFIALLHEEGGLSLRQAKEIKDRVIGEGKKIEIEFKNPALAMLICSESKLLGVKCEIVQ